jgi:hypothetical protein
LRDEEAAYQELLNQRMDLELTKIEYKAELSLNIEDDEIAVIEHQLDMIGDNAFKAAEAIELQIEKAESVYDKIQVNQSALNDIVMQDTIFFLLSYVHMVFPLNIYSFYQKEVFV